MAKKITELTELTTTAEDDLIIIEDVSTSTTKKITKTNFLKTIITDSLTIAGVATPEGWSALGATPNTVTYNGNRSYSLVFNSNDLTDTLSNGMRLKLTRTATAPTQCADLESSSSQYFNKTSPSGMTFTDDFAVSAWIKLESYTGGSQHIASRYNGTSGWNFYINSNGQVVLGGNNAGASNFSIVTSYQSIPLNKWVHVAAQLDMSAFTATTTTSYVMIDGVDVPAAVSRGGTNPTALVQAGNLEVGANNGGSAGNFFDGKIAQVAIYSAKVTQANVRATISQTLTGSETSLISAYRLSNSVTDLNTSNANNLTAQGSATTTNADSPFAGGDVQEYTDGTTEMGLVTDVVFSTNTTLTVQVPEGYAIPTTGGVSAVSYSAHKVPYGFPAKRGKWTVETIIKAGGSTGSLASNAFGNISGHKINGPIGAWEATARLSYVGAPASGTSSKAIFGLSASASSHSNDIATTFQEVTAGTNVGVNHIINAFLDLASATDYYLVAKNGLGVNQNFFDNSDNAPTFIRLECAYV